VFKDEETLKRQRWHSLYVSADKMKLKPSLWQQLLEDLHVLKQQIEASDTASREANAAGNSDVLKLVLALENLDVDEKVRLQISTAMLSPPSDSHWRCIAGAWQEAQKIASAMQRGRRNAVATLEWGEDMSAAAAAAAATAAAAAEAAGTPPRMRHHAPMGGIGGRRHSTPDASSASWSSIPAGHVSDALAKAAAQSDESDSDRVDGASSQSEDDGTEEGCPEASGQDKGSLSEKDAVSDSGDASGGAAHGKLGVAFRAARRRASMENISMPVPTLRRASLSSVVKRHSQSDTDHLSEGVPPANGSAASNARAAGTAFVMRTLTPELEAVLRRVCDDSPDKPQADDVSQLQAVASKAAIGGPLLVPWLRDCLNHALFTEATAAVIKTLRLLMHLIVHSGANKTHFRHRVKADCGGPEGVLSKATTYQPSISDPQLGEVPAAMARKAATQVMALLLGD
jgi:hypothetical protein